MASMFLAAGLHGTIQSGQQWWQAFTTFFENNSIVTITRRDSPEAFAFVLDFIAALPSFEQVQNRQLLVAQKSGKVGRLSTRYTAGFGVATEIVFQGIKFTLQRPKMDGNADGSAFYSVHCEKKHQAHLDTFFETATKWYNDSLCNHVRVFGIVFGNWELIQRLPHRSRESLVLTAKAEKLMDKIGYFYTDDCKRWHEKKCVPYRLGCLLHGGPGTGKSSFVTTAASVYKKDIYYMSLEDRSMSDEEFSRAILSVPPGSMILMEDIDVLSSSHSRSSHALSDSDDDSDESGDGDDDGGRQQSENGAVSLKALLNGTDGVVAQIGSVLFATTNYLDRLDEAFTRDGRFDERLKFSRMGVDEAKKLFRHLIPRAPNDTVDNYNANVEKFGETYSRKKKLTPAELQALIVKFLRDDKREKTLKSLEKCLPDRIPNSSYEAYYCPAVAHWLYSINPKFMMFAEIFHRHMLHINDKNQLTLEELKEMGVAVVGARMAIFNARRADPPKLSENDIQLINSALAEHKLTLE